MKNPTQGRVIISIVLVSLLGDIFSIDSNSETGGGRGECLSGKQVLTSGKSYSMRSKHLLLNWIDGCEVSTYSLLPK